MACILLAGFIVVPLAEIAVLIEVGGWLGLAPTLALIILTAVVGTWMLRRQGTAVLRRAQQQMQQGAVPLAAVFEGFCLVIAGALLLTPGFLTDTAGALLLLPPVRALLYRRMRRRFEEQVRAAVSPHARTGAGSERARPAAARRRADAAGDRCRVRGGRARRHARAARRLEAAPMILVRHAESEWNVHYGRTRIDPGIADPPLTAPAAPRPSG